MNDNELNEAVARKLGHKIGTGKDCVSKGLIYQWSPTDNMPDYVREIPRYSTDIEAAWEVLTYFGDNADITLSTVNGWTCHINWFTKKQMAQECADTAPMAICLAFLKLESK